MRVLPLAVGAPPTPTPPVTELQKVACMQVNENDDDDGNDYNNNNPLPIRYIHVKNITNLLLTPCFFLRVFHYTFISDCFVFPQFFNFFSKIFCGGCSEG